MKTSIVLGFLAQIVPLFFIVKTFVVNRETVKKELKNSR